MVNKETRRRSRTCFAETRRRRRRGARRAGDAVHLAGRSDTSHVLRPEGSGQEKRVHSQIATPQRALNLLRGVSGCNWRARRLVLAVAQHVPARPRVSSPDISWRCVPRRRCFCKPDTGQGSLECRRIAQGAQNVAQGSGRLSDKLAGASQWPVWLPLARSRSRQFDSRLAGRVLARFRSPDRTLGPCDALPPNRRIDLNEAWRSVSKVSAR